MDVTFPLCKSHFRERTRLVLYSFLAHIRQLHGALFSHLSPILLLFLMVYRTFEENKYTGRKGRGLWKPVAAGDKENKNIVRRAEEGSRNAAQQLRAKNAKSEWDFRTWRPKYASDCRHAIFSYSSHMWLCCSWALSSSVTTRLLGRRCFISAENRQPSPRFLGKKKK